MSEIVSNQPINWVLKQTHHRPWELPSSKYMVSQTWEKLTFLHWKFSIAEIRKLVPEPLEIDSFHGEAYVGIIPFYMDAIWHRYIPLIPLWRRFPEINVRTYVKYKGQAGVYFLSLDAAHFLAPIFARRFYKLPYFEACIRFEQVDLDKAMAQDFEEEDEGQIDLVHAHANPKAVLYHSVRKDKKCPAEFLGIYHGHGEEFSPEPGSIEYFLAERYALFTVKKGHVFKSDTHHAKWTIQNGGVDIRKNSMLGAYGLSTQEKPLVHYSQGVHALIWPLRQV